jgi:hypothetical protein
MPLAELEAIRTASDLAVTAAKEKRDAAGEAVAAAEWRLSDALNEESLVVEEDDKICVAYFTRVDLVALKHPAGLLVALEKIAHEYQNEVSSKGLSRIAMNAIIESESVREKENEETPQ